MVWKKKGNTRLYNLHSGYLLRCWLVGLRCGLVCLGLTWSMCCEVVRALRRIILLGKNTMRTLISLKKSYNENLEM